jgi:hypothetical protein
VPVRARIDAPATVDGGDLLLLDERTLLVGRGYRTNAAGVASLRAALPDLDVRPSTCRTTTVRRRCSISCRSSHPWRPIWPSSTRRSCRWR